MARRNWRRKLQKKHQNRGAIFVDNDNLILGVFNPYHVRKTLNSLFDWVAEPDNLGLTRVTARYVYATCENVTNPLPEETGLERRRKDDEVNLKAYPYPQQKGVPSYEDEVIWYDIVESAQNDEADTFVIVTSDWKGFKWADRIFEDRDGIFADKDAVVIYSHLATRADLAYEPRNGVSMEAIYPDLNNRFVMMRGYNPLHVERSLPA
jgi:hypothetical protein